MEATQNRENETQNISEIKDPSPGVKPQKEEKIQPKTAPLQEKDHSQHEAHLSKEAQAPEGMPPWAKAMQSKLEALEVGRKAELSRLQAQGILSKSALPDHLKDKWLSRIQPQGSLPIEDQVKALEEEYAELEKTLLSKASAYGPPLGGRTHAIGEKEVENIVANL